MTVDNCTNKFSLPQLSVDFSHTLKPWKKICVLVLGGKPPEISWLKKIAARHEMWAVDRGIDICYKAGIAPQKLIGDADSANLSSWEWGKAQGAAVYRFPPEKDYTDTQLALNLLKEEKNVFGLLTGSFGGRWDHFYSTLYSAANQPFPCVLADEREVIFFLRDSSSAKIVCRGDTEAVSLLPLSEKVTGVTADGLYWPLNNATLQQKSPQAVSNVPAGGNMFNVAIKTGLLGVYHLSSRSCNKSS